MFIEKFNMKVDKNNLALGDSTKKTMVMQVTTNIHCQPIASLNLNKTEALALAAALKNIAADLE